MNIHFYSRLCVAALCLFSYSLALADDYLPFDLDKLKSIQEAREKLWELKNKKLIDQGQYLLYARRLEPKLRSDELNQAMKRFNIEHTGRPPVQSGGVLSDVDGSARSAKDYQDFLDWVRKKDPRVKESGAKAYDRFSFRSDKYDLVGWRPPEDNPSPTSTAGKVERGMAQALNSELAASAMPGVKPHGLEANLENLVKGGSHLFEKIKPGYQGEANMVQAGKDILRSMRSAGVCEQNPAICGWLNDLKSRAKSPQELGFKDLGQLQTRLKDLAQIAFQASSSKFENEFTELIAKLKKDGSGPEHAKLTALANEMVERAIRMNERIDVLNKMYPNEMRKITGHQEKIQFIMEQNQKIRELRRSQAFANENAMQGKVLTIGLNLLDFAKCMQEEKTATYAARRAKAPICILRVVGLYLKGNLQGKLIVGAKTMIEVYLPNGVMIATIIPSAVAGYALYQSGLQMIDAGFDYWEKNLAEEDADKLENQLTNKQQLNVTEFPRRLALEEAQFAESLRSVTARKLALLEHLEELGRKQTELIETAHFQEHLEQLQNLIPDIKTKRDSCWGASDANTQGISTSKAGAISSLLESAKRDAALCQSEADVQRADNAYHEARTLLDTLRSEIDRINAIATIGNGGRSWDSRTTNKASGTSGLNDAQKIYLKLEELKLFAQVNIQAINGFRQQADALNASIEHDKDSLKSKLNGFLYTVPPELIYLLEQHSARIQSLRDTIAQLEPLKTEQWHPQWQILSKRDAPLRTMINYMNDEGKRVNRLLNDAQECQQRANPLKQKNEALDLAENAVVDIGSEFRAQRAQCVARLNKLNKDTQFDAKVAKEASALALRIDQLKVGLKEANERYTAALRQLQNQRNVAPTETANDIDVTAISGANNLCEQIQAVEQKLNGTLRSLTQTESDLEAGLKQAIQTATSCLGPDVAQQAKVKLHEAAALRTLIDQRSTALALLAVQADSLSEQRHTLLSKRKEIQQALAKKNTPSPNADSSLLNASLSDLNAFSERNLSTETEQHRQRIKQLFEEYKELVSPAAITQAANKLNKLIDGIASLSVKDLQQRAELAASLHRRTGPDAATQTKQWQMQLQTQLQAATCLDHPLPDVRAGIDSADSLRVIAQLAIEKLSASLRQKIANCETTLSKKLSDTDKQEQLAAKSCSYAGSEAVWDEKANRPLCRCIAGRKWNSDQNACVERDSRAEVAAKVCSYEGSEAYWNAQLGQARCRCKAGTQWNKDSAQCESAQATQANQVAQANCSKYPHTEARWSDQKNGVVCSCQPGYRRNADSQTCEVDQESRVANKRCDGEHQVAFWDAANNQAQCGCAQGYYQDPVFATCVIDKAALVAKADCSAYPNAEAYWDERKAKVSCGCKRHFRVGASGRCEPDKPALLANTNCSKWGNARSYWNEQTQTARCQCVDGYSFNTQTNVCEIRQAKARLSEWVGIWNCQATVYAMGGRRRLSSAQIEYAEDGYGGLKSTDGSGEWSTVELIDATHIRINVSDMQPLILTLKSDTITGKVIYREKGVTATLHFYCSR